MVFRKTVSYTHLAKELGIEVPEDEVDKLVTMMQKVSKVDVNVDALKKQAGEIYNCLLYTSRCV